MRTLVLLSLLLGAACSRSPSPDSTVADTAATARPAPSLPAGEVAFRRLRAEPYSFTYNSGFGDSTRLVIADDAAWRSAWATMHKGGSSQPLPAVDFVRERVLLAALGTRPSGGFSILFTGAHVEGDALVAEVVRIRPGPRCGATAALTEPVDLAVVGRTPAVVRFVERDSVSECP